MNITRNFYCPETENKCSDPDCRVDRCVLALRDDISKAKKEGKFKPAGRRRQMIYAPEVNPNTFLFLFSKGDSGYSWSIRDYSVSGVAAAPRYAHEFGFSLDDLWGKVHQSRDAPTHPTSDLDFWHRHTKDLNLRFLGVRTAIQATALHPSPNAMADSHWLGYPILDRDRFERHPKARKSQDRERILFSKASEDWVTWTVFALLECSAPDIWWPQLVKLAGAGNPMLTLPPAWEAKPKLRLWETVRSPAMYEAGSRERMRLSNDPRWKGRVQDPRPVEGDSEIDITLRNDALAVFVEAKLGSDISLRTTYDPQRNQIVRNIDCLLDCSDGQSPMFWMIVRDTNPSRTYSQLIENYRAHPHVLIAELPHQAPERIIAVARNLSLILWRDFLSQTIELSDTDDQEMITVKNELRSRL